MAILGFPLIIPQLMLLMRLSTLAFSDVFQSGLISIILLLVCFDIMIVVLSVYCFPFYGKIKKSFALYRFKLFGLTALSYFCLPEITALI